MTTATPEPRENGRRGALTRGRVGTAALLALVVAVGVWWALLTAAGGHLYMIETPSMARTAPVGSLVVTERVDPSTLHKGDVITFRPPDNKRIYTHRIVEVTDKGFRTKGDLNGSPDGWVVRPDGVIGRAEHLWFGMGYLMKMVPWLALGGFLTAIVRRIVRPRLRPAVVISGVSLAFSVAIVIVRPLVGAVTTGFVPVGDKAVKMSAVGTGILPIRVTSLDDRYVDLVAGQIGWVTTAKADEHGRYQLLPSLHLPWWGWLIMGFVCALPLLVSLAIRRQELMEEPPPPSGGDGTNGPPTHDPHAPKRHRLATRALAALSSIAVTIGMAIGMTPSTAALTARLTNSTDTARIRTYFTCLDAMRSFNTSTGNGELYSGWTVGDGTGVLGVTNQSTYGAWKMQPVSTTVTPATTASDLGCQSDYTARQQRALHLDGSTSQLNTDVGASITQITADPGDIDNMTWTLWFRTTTTTGGVLACPGDSNDYCADYTTWMDNTGHVKLGVGSYTIASPGAYNDGKWHMVAAQSDATTGLKLWMDGLLVASNSATVWNANNYLGYPQFGFSSRKAQDSPLYRAQPTSYYFAGDIQFVGMYGRGSTSHKQLGQTEITNIWESALP